MDHEKVKTIALEVTAQNQAELSGTSAGWNSIPVTVNVLNVDEGPEFSAPNITFNIKENTPNNTLIGRYSAVDPETKSSNGITSAIFAWVFLMKFQLHLEAVVPPLTTRGQTVIAE